MQKSVVRIWKQSIQRDGERRGATFSIRSGTFANHTEGTELQPIRWLSAGSVPKEEKCQAVSESGDVIAFAKR